MIATGCAASSAPSASNNGLVLPDVDVVVLDTGATVQLRDLVRKPTLLNLWASYCTPCRTEMPMLEAFSQQHLGEIAVIGVTDDPVLDKAREIASETGVTYPLFQDEAGVLLRELRVSSLPATYLLSATGRVVWSKVGVLSDADLESVVKTIGESPNVSS
ncbi:MAG: TlpA family protein disulfide reductase [Acidimicrobiales bacterium]|nr:TlpA family protein disulfide reductase [Acidimicrobiales bacterium]